MVELCEMAHHKTVSKTAICCLIQATERWLFVCIPVKIVLKYYGSEGAMVGAGPARTREGVPWRQQ
jgi:hypothetical protein